MYLRLVIRSFATNDAGMRSDWEKIADFADKHGWQKTEAACCCNVDNMGLLEKRVKEFNEYNWVDTKNYDWPTQAVELCIR